MNIQWDPWQKEFIAQEGDKILCCGRQSGKTEISSADASEYAVSHANEEILMIAPTERQAYHLFNKTMNYLLDNHKKKIIIKGKDRPTKSKITLTNKTIIHCLPTGNAGVGIRGLTVHRLYVDEASRVPEEVWEAILPALAATGGDTILLSTPAGRQGEFYRTWINKDGAYESFYRKSISTEIVFQERKISEKWTKLQREKALIKLEQAKARFSQLRYAQEYIGEFIEENFRFFSDELIEEICVRKRQKNIETLKPHFLGVDIARMGGDESTFEVVRREPDGTLIHVENQTTRKTLTTQTRDRIISMDRRYNFKTVAIDAGSGALGVGVYDMLFETPIKRKLEAINNAKRKLDFYGEETTSTVKEDLYDELRSLMQQRKIKLLDDDNIIESLRSIEIELIKEKGRASRVRIYGDYSHIVEGIIRAVHYAKAKNTYIGFAAVRV